ncbi:hypothetical protein [Vibrio phage BX-1]|nr:hypothetical protein [Vibrio phage BX-1]
MANYRYLIGFGQPGYHYTLAGGPSAYITSSGVGYNNKGMDLRTEHYAYHSYGVDELVIFLAQMLKRVSSHGNHIDLNRVYNDRMEYKFYRIPSGAIDLFDCDYQINIHAYEISQEQFIKDVKASDAWNTLRDVFDNHDQDYRDEPEDINIRLYTNHIDGKWIHHHDVLNAPDEPWQKTTFSLPSHVTVDQVNSHITEKLELTYGM